MSLSRLRNPAIARAAHSLIRSRLLSANYTSSSRLSSLPSAFVGQNHFADAKGSILRVLSLSNGSYDGPLRLKVQIRCFSSEEPSSHTVLGMPALSPTMNQGNIAKWWKKEGDKIEVGDILCEIETDKATLEFESLEEGFLAKILAPDGSKDVPVGQPICVMNQGNIVKWRKYEGDKIEVGDVICEIETDKATLEFESLEEGYLAKIVAPEGAKDVAVGQPIFVTVEDPDDIETVKTSFSSAPVIKGDKPAQQDAKKEVSEQKGSFTKISPSAKILISEYGLDISSLKATGPRGTLLRGDVLAAIKSGKGASRTPSKEKASPSPQAQPQSSSPKSPKSDLRQSDSFEDLPNTQIRKVIARRLLESKQNTPHLYLSSDVILDPLLAFRKDLKEKDDIKVSVNDIVIKAVAVALKNVPEANAYWDVKKGEIVLWDSVDISIAVATEKGLMTPIIRNADQKSISSISAEVKELAEKAKKGKLRPDEFQGGTFSISNLGMFPVDSFCAIINPPQAGILAVGRGNKVVEPVIGSDGIERPAVISKMNVTLSADHRVFDGKVGGAFLSALRSNFSDIRRLIL